MVLLRVIKGFMIQGGDFTRRNGSGGESIYGANFPDESFARKHTTHGLLSMANRGPNTQSSQFFITTRPTPHLDGKHVVFGRVVSGFDIVQKLENEAVDERDRPLRNILIANSGELILKLPPGVQCTVMISYSLGALLTSFFDITVKGKASESEEESKSSRKRSRSVSSGSESGSDSEEEERRKKRKHKKKSKKEKKDKKDKKKKKRSKRHSPSVSRSRSPVSRSRTRSPEERVSSSRHDRSMSPMRSRRSLTPDRSRSPARDSRGRRERDYAERDREGRDRDAYRPEWQTRRRFQDDEPGVSFKGRGRKVSRYH